MSQVKEAVLALDAASGEQRWVFATGDVVMSMPAVSDGKVFVGGDDGIVYALEANPVRKSGNSPPRTRSRVPRRSRVTSST